MADRLDVHGVGDPFGPVRGVGVESEELVQEERDPEHETVRHGGESGEGDADLWFAVPRPALEEAFAIDQDVPYVPQADLGNHTRVPREHTDHGGGVTTEGRGGARIESEKYEDTGHQSTERNFSRE